MALAYSTAIQNRVANILRGTAYASLTANEKALIDSTSTPPTLTGGVAFDALTQIQQYAQWFGMSGTTVPDAWEQWLVSNIVLLASQQMCPDRVSLYEQANLRAEQAAVDAFSRNALSYAPGATPEASTLTVQNIRYYVVSHCARTQRWDTIDGTRRMKPRLWVPPEIIDAMIDRVLISLWGQREWRFKKRKTRMLRTVYSFSDATYTNGTKTIATTGLATIPAGSRVLLTSGTGVTAGEYSVASGTSTTIVLDNALGTAADGATDLAGSVFVVTFPDLLSTETYDAMATREAYYTQPTSSTLTGVTRSSMVWVEDDTLASWRSRLGTTTGSPAFYQTEVIGTRINWHFCPFPSETETLYGSVYVQGPRLPAAVDTSTVFERFPADFAHLIKDSVLSEVLAYFGDDRMKARVEAEVERLGMAYADEGRGQINQEIRDVYGDFNGLTSAGNVGSWY